MEAVVDIKYRPTLYRHGGMVEAKAKNLGSPAAGVYLECLRNDAASAGGHVVDGCGEFMPAPVASLRCAACGCHRSFHRRVIAEGSPRPPPSTVVAAAPHLLRYGRPLHDEGTSPEDRVPGVGADDGWDETDEESDYDDGRPMSPPPTGYLAPAPPQMLLSLNTGAPAPGSAPAPVPSRPPAPVPSQGTVPGESLAAARKRFRTKFSPGQKQRMRELSERLGWRLQRRDEATVADCCREIGVTRGVFEVWMHNNKHNFVGGLHSARQRASSASVSPIPVPDAAVVQPPSHTAATPPPAAAAAASAPPPPPVVHADFNINGSAEYCFVQQATATASGGAQSS